MLISKARTLTDLAKLVRSAVVPEFTSFPVSKWRRSPETALAQILEQFSDGRMVIVRSSAADEDTSQSSSAGKYLSVVCELSDDALSNAVDAVIASYGRDRDEDEVLVQAYVDDAIASGVAFNRDPRSGALYDVINYTLGSDTTTVTSGAAGRLVSHVRSRFATRGAPTPVDAVPDLLREIEAVLGDIPLDVEFAVRDGGRLHLLQARPLICSARPKLTPERHGTALEEARTALAAFLGPSPDTIGRRSILGVMPDWNPAEIIGLRPRPLALSLYRLLITDTIWAERRRRLGYRHVRDVPLVISLHGLPYVDVRASFASLLPAGLRDDVAARVVDAAIDRLADNPHLHDKVEFEVLPTSWSFDLADRTALLDRLSAEDRSALARALLDITRDMLSGPGTALLDEDRANIAALERRQSALSPSVATGDIGHLYRILGECRRYGTGPFVGLARAAFVGTDLLRSSVAAGHLEPAAAGLLVDHDDLPATRFLRDLRDLPRAEVLRIYGHLRPGTYDIRVPTYAEEPDRYLSRAPDEDEGRPREIDRRERIDTTALGVALRASGLGVEPETLIRFAARMTLARETAKFVFSRSVSRALDELAVIGARLGFSREDMSFVDIRDVLDLRASTWKAADAFSRSIDEGRARYEITSALCLPPVVTSASAIDSFTVSGTLPRFVTCRVAEGRVTAADADDLRGAVVMIPSADPGYDWLFGRRIAGFVTAWGGSNSHMAIRAAELDVPAVIGAGEGLFDLWSRAKRLRLDCGSERVEVVR